MIGTRSFQMNKKDLLHLKKILASEEVDEKILLAAITHPSYAMEHPGETDYERLEFLGDAVVDLIIGQYLFSHYPEKDEGSLTRMRASLVNEQALAQAARTIQLGEWMRFGNGEIASGGGNRPSNLSNSFEAVCAALYLSQGLEATSYFVLSCLKGEISKVEKGYYGDYKSRLQEYIQKDADQKVSYCVREESGPAHDKRFLIELFINEEKVAQAWGRSKKEAERYAALAYLIEVGEINPNEDESNEQ